jgi:integrase/recombinase XerD
MRSIIPLNPKDLTKRRIRRCTMTTQESIRLFENYLHSNRKRRTIDSYVHLLSRFERIYAERALDSIGPNEIYTFLESLTQDLAKSTRRLRYAQLKAFYNFIIERCSLIMKNPCNTSLLSKSYRTPKQTLHKILERETVDEMIYNTKGVRDRLILELQARCGLRIGELLKIRVSDISDRTITLREPKSGKESELAYMPENVSKKLVEYIKDIALQSDDRPFPICYSTARALVRRLGEKVNIRISPHDLRRYSATYASRNGVPLEVVSKVILRHQDLKTTQVYLGKISDSEAIRWMDILHGK